MQQLFVLSLAAALCAYLICGIPFGLIIGKLYGHIDVRNYGSGNIGMTNVARNLGALPAVLTLFFDAAKAYVSLTCARYFLLTFAFGGDASSVTAGAPLSWTLGLIYLFCILGHVFSPYLKFHGGKGISSGFGGALALDYRIALALLVSFLIVAFISKYISLASCTAAALLPIFAKAFGHSGLTIILLAISALVVIYSHRENIRRLLKGSERRFSLGKKDGHVK